MLDFCNFVRIDGNIIQYMSDDLYTIFKDEDESYTVIIQTLDENGNMSTEKMFAASSLSTAVAIIEEREQ